MTRKNDRKEKMNFGAVIAAAGMSKRMKDFKQLMKIEDMTFTERVIANYRDAGIRDIVVITGYRGDELEESVKGSGAVFIRNEEYENTHMFDSALMGLSYLRDRCDAVFFSPVDVPSFTEDTIRAMTDSAEKADVIVPWCQGRPGHPLLISRKAVDFMLTYNGHGGLRGAYEDIRASGYGSVLDLPVEDDGSIMDADTREDYENLIKFNRVRHSDPLASGGDWLKKSNKNGDFGNE